MVECDQGKIVGFFFFFFGQESRIYWWARVRWGQHQGAQMQGPAFVQRATIRDVFDPTAIQDELLFAVIFSNSSTLNLMDPHFLEMWLF